ncbi:hypothetical protein [Streptomyces hesseae]|uniref:Secreted protein n=1 Tax=Streptomyces hesseae TaxID=3075519 RepID=A0ABU2SXJ8_9ACTN|nr:hypothetical protein [Streptomyces sp. DSM 40473]MDT0453681.1 hypothetical protein [Streptomyces sp. DSM 40473]
MVNTDPAAPRRGVRWLVWAVYGLAAGVTANGAAMLAASAADGSVLVQILVAGAVVLAAGWIAPTVLASVRRRRFRRPPMPRPPRAGSRR